jgi:two-component system alkaline phosphatase synthesis response regulator PhoP
LKTILVIDDQMTIRELVTAALGSEEWQVVQKGSGEAGIESARRQKPDLILLDIMLPEGIDGYETARMLKSDPETQAIPIIALTAKVQQNDRNEAFLAGFDDYLAKPFSLKVSGYLG